MESDIQYSQLKDENIKQSITLVDNQDFYYRKLERFTNSSFYVLDNSNIQQPVLSDQFFFDDELREEEKFTLKCTYHDIVIYPSSNLFRQTTLHQKDLVGAEIHEGKENSQQKAHKLTIVLMIKQTEGCCTKKNQRKKFTHTLYRHDYEKLRIWQNLIQHIAKDPEFLQREFTKLSKQELHLFTFRFLVFINPNSGPGHAKKIWKKAKSLLKISGYVFTEIYTERVNHARDVILNISSEELQQFCGIITVSGDGLPHEVVNALAQREDSEEALKIGVAPLPAGSGNALIKNMASRSNEREDLDGSVFQIIKNRKFSIDLVEVQIENSDPENPQQIQKETVYSFLSLSCAYIADVDLNSEKLRCLGEMRFDIWGVYRVFCQQHIDLEIDITRVHQQYLEDEQKKKFKALKQTSDKKKNISVQTKSDTLCSIIEEEQSNQSNMDQVPKHKEKFKGKCKYLLLQNMPYLSTSNYTAPHSEMNDGFLDFQLIINAGWCSLLHQALDFQDGKQFKKNKKGIMVPKSRHLRHRMVTEFCINSLNGNQVMYSIDGEKYMAQTLIGKIMPKAFTIFCMDP